MKYLILTLTLFSFSVLSYAQLVGSASFGNEINSSANLGTVGLHYGFDVLNEKLTIATGVRLGAFSGSGLKYITAPDELTSDDKNVDTLLFGTAKVKSINLNFKLEYNVYEKFTIGVDFDLVGLSFGSTEKKVPLIQGVNHSRILYLLPPVAEEVSPTSSNVLNIGDKKKGSLNTSIYGSYNITENIAISAGYRFVCTEYTTNFKVGWNQHDRFRNRSSVLFLGGSYKILKKSK